MGKFGPIEILLILMITVPFYFLPAIIALNRKKTGTATIIILNLFLGWTVVGWVVTFIWACSTNHHNPFTVKNNHKDTAKEEKIEFPRQSLHQKLENLRQLKELLESGTLSQEEYEKEKEELLGR